jgi:glycerophosphoryl diester phosphodiesterase
MQPFIIAHRGDSARRPENTPAAFALALAVGAELVELDVRLSRDGHVVVIHDATVDRTTDGTGEVAALTLAEIRRLSAGVVFDERFRDERVPTLEEALALLKGRARVMIEIKTDAGAQDGSALVDANLTDGVAFNSFDPAALERCRQRLPAVPRGLLVYRAAAAEAVRLAAELDCELVLPEKSLADASWMEAAGSRGLQVATWVVDTVEDFEVACRLGLAGVGTNRPSLLIDHQRQRREAGRIRG